MAIVLPEGVFGNKQTAYVWDWLEAQGSITALLDCPRTTFQPGTDTKTNVLFFRRGELGKSAGPREDARVAVALHCGHDRRGRASRNGGDRHPDDFEIVARDWRVEPAKQATWRTVNLTGKRYLVPRYYYEASVDDLPEHDWVKGARVASLGELLKDKVISLRKGHEVGSEAYGTGQVPFVRTSDLANFEISTDPTKSVSDAIYREYSRQQDLRPGDILLVVDGRYRIGAAAMLTTQNCRCVVQSHLRIISTRHPELLDPYGLLLALSLPSTRLRLRSLVFVQSTLGTLGARLLELRIPILTGDGQWAPRVVKFRDSLQRRAALLAELEGMSGPDYEI
jgi:type I restriction enzyme M protein